jgi:hypothetical protein
MAEGIDTLKVIAEHRVFIRADWSEVNMMAPHQRLKIAIATELNAMNFSRSMLMVRTESTR